jgi:signal transduction histidine kinase
MNPAEPGVSDVRDEGPLVDHAEAVPRGRMPATLRTYAVVAAVIAVWDATATLLDEPVVRGGLFSTLAIAAAAVGLTRTSRKWHWAALGVVLAGAFAITVPGLFGAVPAADATTQRAFVALTWLAVLATALFLVPHPVARRLVAVLAGCGIMVVVVRSLAAIDPTDQTSAAWPPLHRFAPALALCLCPLWALLDELRVRMPWPRRAVYLLTMLMLGHALMVCLGTLLGSPLLMRGIGEVGLAWQGAFATAVAALMLLALSERLPIWRWLLAVIVLHALALIVALTFGERIAPLGRVVGGELLENGRGAPMVAWLLIVAAGSLLLLVERMREWAMRLAWSLGLVAAGYALVMLSGVFAGVLFGFKPAAQGSLPSFLGLLSVVGVASIGFFAAIARVDPRRARREALPASLLVMALAISYSLYVAAEAQADRAVAATTRVALNALGRTVKSELEDRVADFERLARQLADDSAEQRSARIAAAGHALTQRYPALYEFGWRGDDGEVAGFANPDHAADLPAATRALMTQRALASALSNGSALTVGSGGLGWPVIAIAVHIDATKSGDLIVLLGTDADAVQRVLSGAPPGYNALIELDGQVLRLGDREPASPSHTLPTPVHAQSISDAVGGAPLRVVAWATPETLATLRSRLPLAILVGGGLVAMLLAGVAVLGQVARERAAAAESAGRVLRHEVADRERAQAEAERSRREIGAIIEGVPYGFLVVDRDWRYTYANRTAETLLRTQRGAVLGRAVFDTGNPDPPFELEPMLARTMHERSIEAHEYYNMRRGRWFAVHSFPLPDGIGIVFRDVSAERATLETLRRREAEREAALKDLETRNDELQQFAYVASHDLQEPLRKIQAFGDRLRDQSSGTLTDSARDYLDRMQSAAGRMSALIDDVLSYSRVTTRAAPFGQVDLRQVIEQVQLDLELGLRESGACMQVGHLPTIEADVTQMSQLFQNLIGNAIKYRSSERTLEVRIEAEPISGSALGRGDDRDWVRISVRDNGIGFDNRYAERIFSPFQRLHGRGEYSGTGIGLAIVRKIVERHGGRVHADGTAGRGATFTIELPGRQSSAPSASGAPHEDAVPADVLPADARRRT